MKYENLSLGGLAERLVAARRAAKLTQEDAAAHLDMSRPTFIAMEKGKRRPKRDELLKLAALYQVSLNTLLRNEARAEPLTPHLRSALDLSAKEQPGLQAAVDLLAAYIDDYCFLETLMGSRGKQAFPPPVRPSSNSIERFAEHCAQEERARLNLGSHQPIHTPRKALEEAGVHVFMGKLDSKLAGLYAFVPGFGYCILVNSSHNQGRRHWTIAHEYGHFLLDRDTPGVDFAMPMQRKSESERFADAFAAAFLMPETGVRRRFYEELERSGDFKVGDLCRMADYFSVSLMAMALRLEALGLIPRGSWDAIAEAKVPARELREEAGVGYVHVRDSLDAYPERYKMLAVQAFESEQITEGQLAKLLRCSRIEARGIVAQCQSVFGDNGEVQAMVSLPLSHSLLTSTAS